LLEVRIYISISKSLVDQSTVITLCNDGQCGILCRCWWTVRSGVEFATEENRPARFDLKEFEVCSEAEAMLWDEQIDSLIGRTKLLCPANR